MNRTISAAVGLFVAAVTHLLFGVSEPASAMGGAIAAAWIYTDLATGGENG